MFSLVFIVGLALSQPAVAQSVQLEGADGRTAALDAEAEAAPR
ncbi:hypothetical protein [Brevundimonas sp.]